MAVSSNTSDWFPNTAATHHITPDLASPTREPKKPYEKDQLKMESIYLLPRVALPVLRPFYHSSENQVSQVMHQVKMFPFTREKSIEGPHILEFLFQVPFDLQFFNRLAFSHLNQTRHRFMIFVFTCTWPRYALILSLYKKDINTCKYFLK
ncbi:hypothetical protein NC652_036468 [Populus alba x Populus x berolinensis]|nr:hypothetical protein NC652_036468 [Populus alba x Populus x berolinensis]